MGFVRALLNIVSSKFYTVNSAKTTDTGEPIGVPCSWSILWKRYLDDASSATGKFFLEPIFCVEILVIFLQFQLYFYKFDNF